MNRCAFRNASAMGCTLSKRPGRGIAGGRTPVLNQKPLFSRCFRGIWRIFICRVGSGIHFALGIFVIVNVTVTGGWQATQQIMERGWFPRTVPPAGGLRAVHCPGLKKCAGLFDDNDALKHKIAKSCMVYGATPDATGFQKTILVSSSAKAARTLTLHRAAFFYFLARPPSRRDFLWHSQTPWHRPSGRWDGEHRAEARCHAVCHPSGRCGGNTRRKPGATRLRDTGPQ
jgi:hypothetical protein